MTGITAMFGALGANAIYAAGLVIPGLGVDLSPIDGALSGNNSIDRTWIGYFTPAADGQTQLGLQTQATRGGNGDAFTLGQLWLGPTAISGATDANANLTSFGSQTVTGNFPMSPGVYYPIRLRWVGNYRNGSFPFSGTSSGSFAFFAASNFNVSNRIFYNTLTGGF
jgi:hypothetical protein